MSIIITEININVIIIIVIIIDTCDLNIYNGTIIASTVLFENYFQRTEIYYGDESCKYLVLKYLSSLNII